MQYNSEPAAVNEQFNAKMSERSMVFMQTCFAQINKDVFIGAFPSIPTLPSGVYTLKTSDQFGCEFHRLTINADDYMPFAEGTVEAILSDITNFWTKKEIYNKLGFVHRRGFMLYGPQGSGKSTLVYQACDRFTKDYNGVSLMVSGIAPQNVLTALNLIRRIDPDRKLMIIFEDIDAYINRWGEEVLLNMLDGESTITDSVILATTNYINRIDPRIVCRPRRFDRIIKVDLPKADIRAIYFKNKLDISDEELDKYVKASKDFTFAAMAELVISVKALNIPLKEAASTLHDILQNKASYDPICTESPKSAGYLK